jgi:hypothetical protein
VPLRSIAQATLSSVKEPFGTEVLFESEHGGKIAPQLLAKPVGIQKDWGTEGSWLLPVSVLQAYQRPAQTAWR